MITLQPINETNFMEAALLTVSEKQREFVASAPMILARSYAYRDQNAICWGIYKYHRIVGLAMLHDMNEDPACYHLCEFLIDQKQQSKGIGQAALRLILDHCRCEHRFNHVEVCVRKENAAAIHVYEKAGFRSCGYQDPDLPNSICMVCNLWDIQIRTTGCRDLSNVQQLWATPEVMCFVGFPDGLQESMEHLETEWLPWV
ncbi:MAG: GNAT family N-acetyltransferase [Oscillospiraceae bacterium]|nr:GNAT family N-acetyltransferase [Oscillospiraceae bacterium]